MTDDRLKGLIPYPREVEVGAGSFSFSSRTTLDAGAFADVAEVFVTDVLHDGRIAIGTGAHRSDSVIRLEAVEPAEAARGREHWLSPNGASGDDESYRLVIGPDLVTVSATTAEGIHRGLTTLRQLVNAYRSPDVAMIPAATISDSPAYGWRGLTVDVARTFLDVNGLSAIVDALSLYKMNVLHLHLTDNDGWRIEVEGWPLLTAESDAKRAAGRTSEHYSADDYRRIVNYAATRFVTVVPEIDIPGHAESVLSEYPSLGVAGEDGYRWLSPDSDETLQFVEEVLSQVSRLTGGLFLHLGADEPFGMPSADYAAFMRRALPLAAATGKNLIGWQEASRAGATGFAAFQCWIDRDLISLIEGDLHHHHLTPVMIERMRESFSNWDDDALRAVELGAKIIASPTSHAYLDVGYAEADSDAEQEDERLGLGYSIYPRVDIREFAEWTVADSVPAAASGAVAGVEAAIWGETTQTLGDVQFLTLPRLPAIAQRGWSEASIPWDSYASALAAQEEVWRKRGWNYFRSSLVFAPRSHAS